MGCSNQKAPPIENLRGGNIQVIGHGGSGFLSLFSPFNALPPNSLASLSKALFVDKSDGVEIDVQMSKDSVLILYHDKKLESKTSSQGYVPQYKGRVFNIARLFWKGLVEVALVA